MTTADSNAIEVTKLKKQFGDFVAVKEVSFTVRTGASADRSGGGGV